MIKPTLRQILEELWNHGRTTNPYPHSNDLITIDHAEQAIKQHYLGLIPEKMDMKFNKYHHQTQVEGYNQAIEHFRQAIESEE